VLIGEEKEDNNYSSWFQCIKFVS